MNFRRIFQIMMGRSQLRDLNSRIQSLESELALMQKQNRKLQFMVDVLMNSENGKHLKASQRKSEKQEAIRLIA